MMMQSLAKTYLALSTQFRRLITSASGIERRENRIMGVDHERAASGDHHAVGKRFRKIGKQLGHLIRRLQPMLRRQPLSLLDPNLDTLLDADQNVMRLILSKLQEMHIVGGDKRQIESIGKIDQRFLDPILVRIAVTHQLYIKTAVEDIG